MTFLGFADPSGKAPQRPLEAPVLHVEGPLTVALQGGPVALDGKVLTAPGKALAEAWRQRGTSFLSGLTGSFALVIIDGTAGRVLLALDRMGIERLTYARLGEGLVFSSSAEAVARYPGMTASLRTQAIFDYLMLHMVPAPHTIYRDVYKLRPGTCAILEKGTLRIERYWVPRFAMGNGADFQSLRDQLHASLSAAVKDCQPDERTGAFLSGGLDSSTVVGVYSKVAARPVRSFSMGFGVQEFNEIEYARIANRRFGAHGLEYDVTADDVVDAFGKIAAAYDEPFGNSSAIPTYCCAKVAAEHGMTHLLAGDGGDELFAGNERYAKQKIFEAWWRLPMALRKGVIQPLLSGIDPENGRIMPLRKARSYVDQASIPMPERLESWNYMYRIDLGGMLEGDFRASIDTRAPLATMAEVYAEAPSKELVHRMLFYDWHYTLSDNDLRKVGTMCKLAGVKVSYPMLDARLIDLSLRVPLPLMAKGLELRSFYKRAMQGFLPDEILNKKKHGFGLPFGVWLKTHGRLRELIYGLLAGLKTRGIVKPDFLDNLVQEHQKGHPGYYGYAIWDLAMLEAWLAAHVGRAAVY
jgi:asparagine synthase (glutamine-hydrolysing)